MKILANRLKGCLADLISINQSAFVPGRQISDNILLTQELMHNYHLDRGLPRAAFKVDIQKAYDTVDWNFLRCILKGFGFHDRMIHWIMECVLTPSYSICINGITHGFFRGRRGLRQGDPLSPYLFTLDMEILTLILKRRADIASVKTVMESLDDYKSISRLAPSLPKSTAFFRNVLNHVKLSILSILPFKEGRLPVKYLGVPLISSRLMLRDCKIGNGNNCFTWFDNWSRHGPIYDKLSPRLIANVGFTLNSKVSDIIVNGDWSWPIEWWTRFSYISPPVLDPLKLDAVKWKDRSGNICDFSVSIAWQDLRPRANRVWDSVRIKAQVQCSSSLWNEIVADVLLVAHQRMTYSVALKFLLAASVYFIWQERNARIFSNRKRSAVELIDVIISNVRMKLLTIRFKKTARVEDLRIAWDLPLLTNTDQEDVVVSERGSGSQDLSLGSDSTPRSSSESDASSQPRRRHRRHKVDVKDIKVQIMERIMEIKGYDDRNGFKVAVMKLSKYASAWYENMKGEREYNGKSKVKT
uniref:uncharacterized protein LOC122584456 n=1 Tax=Erigeron canadensis TaxID=72917 RepID=UPI001CB8CB55|nr:uncharacterized protein LOC122584456 [Erigeron canadensis]